LRRIVTIFAFLASLQAAGAAEQEKPVAEQAKPAAEPEKPVAEQAKPAAEPEKPAAEEGKPVAEPEKPAANPRDVQAHFIKCFQTPPGMEKMQGTFHFSLNRDGELIGPPRIAWLKLDKRRESQKQLEERLVGAFRPCFPVRLSKEMARMTPGNLLYFRFGALPKTGKDKSRPVFNGPID
jgi:hypothetical protein